MLRPSSAELWRLLTDLHHVRPARVYAELLLTGVVTWMLDLFLVIHPVDGVWCIGFVLGSLCLYRGVSFSHEVAHLRNRVRWIRFVYNALFGIPNRVPAYTVFPHRYHHGIQTFGTAEDPEYEKWTEKSPWFLARPLVVSAFFPVFVTLRLGVWPWLLLLLPRRWTEATYRRASSLAMNVAFERPHREDDSRAMFREDLCAAVYFAAFCALTAGYGLLMKASVIWFLQAYFVGVLNTYRALVAHRYQAHRGVGVRSRASLEAQLADSVTIEGAWWTALWAPIGLRHHSTHHLFPQIPYYALAKAHARIKAAVPANHPYALSIEPGFWTAFFKLARACRSRSTANPAAVRA